MSKGFDLSKEEEIKKLIKTYNPEKKSFSEEELSEIKSAEVTYKLIRIFNRN